MATLLDWIGSGMGMPKAPAPAPAPAPMPMNIRQPQPMSQVPEQGFGGPQGGMSLADILNGPKFLAPPAQQLPATPATGVPQMQPLPMPTQGQGLPQPTQLSGMPNPQRPQMDFMQFGNDQMAQILAGQRG